MQKRIILKIYGRVQGVFFRDSSRRKAKELNLSGWARNELDGTVQIVAEGEEGELRELIKWCRNGLHHGKVEEMNIEWVNPTGEFNGFLIL